MQTLSDLFKYANRISRLNPNDYFEPGYSKPYEVALYRRDLKARENQRRACHKLAKDKTLPLAEGNYGLENRLEITTLDVDYCAGLYPAAEIWPAVLAYLKSVGF